MHVLDPNSLELHLDRLYRAAWAFCGTREDAEDLVQETLAGVLERRRVVRGMSDFNYLMRAMRNTWVSRHRADGARPQLVAEAEEPTDRRDPLAAIEIHELYACVAALPEEFRSAIVAVDVAGMSYEEAAAMLGLGVSTLSTRVHRARKRVVEAYDGVGESSEAKVAASRD